LGLDSRFLFFNLPDVIYVRLRLFCFFFFLAFLLKLCVFLFVPSLSLGLALNPGDLLLHSIVLLLSSFFFGVNLLLLDRSHQLRPELLLLPLCLKPTLLALAPQVVVAHVADSRPNRRVVVVISIIAILSLSGIVFCLDPPSVLLFAQ